MLNKGIASNPRSCRPPAVAKKAPWRSFHSCKDREKVTGNAPMPAVGGLGF